MDNYKRGYHVVYFLISIIFLSMSGCKWVKLEPDQVNPKLGDILNVKITAGESSNIDKINYKIDDITGSVTSVPYTVTVNTCKGTGTYHSQLSLWGEAIYKDGTKKTFSKTYDLTVGALSRHNSEFTYVFYISNSDDDWEHMGRHGADAFIDNFGSYSDHRYFWSDPSLYSSTCGDCANNFDMVISWGHGSPHYFYTAGGSVDVSATAYGSCANCNTTGDPKYLAFASCSVLSMDDYDSKSFWYYWFTEYNTRLDKRPFQGLHMIMGFRTLMVIDYWEFLWWEGNNADDFFKSFANKLDDGWAVREAWIDAVGDELDFDDGNNRGAVMYLPEYENDDVTPAKDDYIYGNANYNTQCVEYWD